MDAVEITDPTLMAEAAELWLDADAVRAGYEFDPAYAEEQRSGFLHAAAQPDAWVATISRDEQAIGLVGGFRDGTEVGSPSNTTAYLAWVAVAPDQWGHGIGDRLIAYAERRAEREGTRAIVLWVHADNARARRLYERRGWALTGDTQRIPGNGELLVRYRITLDQL